MASDLVTYVSKLLPSANLSDVLDDPIKKKDVSLVLLTVRFQIPQLLALESETDVEGAFSLLFDVVVLTSKPEHEFLTILQALQADKKASNVLCIRLLAALYNKANRLPKVQLQTLLEIFSLAQSSDNVNLIDPYLPQVETLATSEIESPTDRRALLLAVANVLDQSPDKKLNVLSVLEQYLATYKEGETDKEQTLRACKMVLQNPVASFLARVDLAALPVVKASLHSDPMYELLEIMSTKTVKEFVTFRNCAKSVFADNGLDEANVAVAMRLFTLCTLPTGFQANSYADVATALDVDDEDVEQWVVRAITAGLVSAKIDQLARTVTISHSLQRRFGDEQWNEMHEKLQSYKKNVGGLLNVIRNARRAQKAQ
uniref:PCI domain-containing protein n=1 Tax=Hyaloperonospora arabidopsidis (strain Emoy2) TaxID=559515 RepID=M4BC51_HYAAE